MAPDVSLKLKPKKSGRYHLMGSATNAVTIDVDGLRNVVAGDRIMLEKGANEGGHHKEAVSVDMSSATELLILNDRQANASGVKAENVMTHENAEHTRQEDAGPLADKDGEKG